MNTFNKKGKNMDAETRLAKAYSKAGGGNVDAMPWADIIAIVMKVLAGCTTSQAKSFVKAHPVAAQFLIERSLKDDADLSLKNRKAMAKAAVDAFAAMPASDIDDMR